MALAPNLTVIQLSQHVIGGQHHIQLLVINNGNKACPEVKPGLYVNALAAVAPAGQNIIRVQNSHTVPALPRHGVVSIVSTFDEDKLSEEHVVRFEVLVDPKVQVKELSEADNIASFGRA
ncbi:MAG: hypothetical protein IPK82_34080 [Polyangiaceae bacterium]|nr:hypothetical protein [Polyangiaceae bacterium]